LVGLIAASVVAYRREGRPWARTPFRERFRLGRMRPSMWAWTAGLSVVMVAVPGLLSATSTRILELAPPAAALGRMLSSNATTVMGVSLAGAWWVLPVFLLLITLNVAGEELWWRGYVLPRQELAFGRWTWLVHGVLWTVFHTFFYWEIVALLPGCLALSYVACHSRSTWPGVVAHAAANLPTFVILVLGVAG